MTSSDHDALSKPSQFLVDNLDLLPVGKALDIAMGAGRNALFLAAHGFTVEGVDYSADSVNQALKIAHEKGLPLVAFVADLEAGYQIQSDIYDLIICFNYLQRSLFPGIKAGLKIGGLVVYETFTVDQVMFGRPRNPEFLLKHNELLDIFRDFRTLFYREEIVDNRKAVASLIAQKVK
jgi:tellurite methyltransferase